MDYCMSTINVNTLRTAAGASPVLVSEIAKTTDLAAPTGAGLVGYMPDGVGGVGTTVAGFLHVYQTVVNLGADPTGVADSSAAFTNAMLRDVVIIPAGEYSLSGLFYPRSGQKFIALGKVTLKKKAADTNAYTMFYMADKSDIVFDEQIIFDGNGANQTASGSSGKGIIEIWNASFNIALNNVKVINGYKWGIYTKGSGGIIPLDVKLNGVITSGSLGYVGGIAGADGTNGLVIIAGAVEAINCTFYDRIDLEANVAGQSIEANFSNSKFFSMFDSGVNGTAGALTVTGCTFYAKEALACARIYGGTFSGNEFTNKYNSTTLATEWHGIQVLGNNNDGVNITGNKMFGPYTGIGFAGPNRAKVSGNHIVCGATTTGSVTLDSQTVPWGGITCGTTGAVRGVDISSNTVMVTAAFNTAGGYGIDARSTDCRGVTYMDNSVITDAYAEGKMYCSVSRSYPSRIGGNSAFVTSNLSGSYNVQDYASGSFLIRGGDKNTAPAGGTFALTDRAIIANATAAGYTQWHYTTTGWKRCAIAEA